MHCNGTVLILGRFWQSTVRWESRKNGLRKMVPWKKSPNTKFSEKWSLEVYFLFWFLWRRFLRSQKWLEEMAWRKKNRKFNHAKSKKKKFFLILRDWISCFFFRLVFTLTRQPRIKNLEIIKLQEHKIKIQKIK